MPRFTATLMGGPKHGKVVEIIGMNYKFAEKLPEKEPLAIAMQRGLVRGLCLAFDKPVPEWANIKRRYGIYEWDYDHDHPDDESKYVGIWKGYKE